jgi:metal-responsive CopG/Arc/MetJ family transcriptional regulator
MPAAGKVRITVDEDPAIVARLDALADEEGLSRNDIVRRAIRRLLFSLSNGSTDGSNPQTDRPVDIAA